MKAALEYLNLIPGEATADVAVLRDRIYRSGAPGVSEAAAPPPFPFIAEEVPVDAAAAHHASTAHAQHAQGDWMPRQPALSACSCSRAFRRHVLKCLHRCMPLGNCRETFGCHGVAWKAQPKQVLALSWFMTLLTRLHLCSDDISADLSADDGFLRAQHVHCGRRLQGPGREQCLHRWQRLQPSSTGLQQPAGASQKGPAWMMLWHPFI